MSFIFISYSRQDQAYVSTLVQALQSHRLPIWIDDRIDYGTDWPDVIEEHLEQSAVFLLVMSPRSKRSHWVNCELTRAIELHKPIFPMLLEGCRWLQVATKQSVDVVGGKLPEARFFDSLRRYFPAAEATAESLSVQDTIKDQIPKIAGAALSASYGKFKTTNSMSFEIELKSEKGINYTRLRDLLNAGEWEAADRETADQMFKVMGKYLWNVRSGDLLSFPCVDLKTIDQLWVKYSNGKWGFSVQKQIYVECGAKLDGQYPGNDICREFCRRVGWVKGDHYLEYSDMTFDIQTSSTGQFPARCLVGKNWGSTVWVSPSLRQWGEKFSSLALRLTESSR